MPGDEGEALIASLMEAVMAPDIVYRHVWRDNDWLLWDNQCMLHHGQPFDNQKCRRHMIHTTVSAA